MKKKEFALRLCAKLEPRILEICRKFESGNVNGASLPAFWLATHSDICSFLEDKKLEVRKR